MKTIIIHRNHELGTKIKEIQIGVKNIILDPILSGSILNNFSYLYELMEIIIICWRCNNHTNIKPIFNLKSKKSLIAKIEKIVNSSKNK